MPPDATTNNFLKWLMTARPGDVCVYHTGDLAYDRTMGHRSNGGPGAHEWPEHMKEKGREINALGRAVWTAYVHGDVTLTQKRLSEGLYQYRATRTRRDRAI